MSEYIVFIDLDGPMFPTKTLLLPENQVENSKEKCFQLGLHERMHYWKMDIHAVAMLNKLHAEFAFEMVVSSSWSHPQLHDRTQIDALFRENDINIPFHLDWTTPKEDPSRLKQISQWIAKHPELKDYIIIDDWGSGADLAALEDVKANHLKTSRIILVDEQNGISMADYQKMHTIIKKWKMDKKLGC